MPDYVLEQIVNKARDARSGGFSVLSTGEKLAAAVLLNRHDWLVRMDYTMVEAIARIGPEWMARLPAAARILAEDEDAPASNQPMTYSLAEVRAGTGWSPGARFTAWPNN